MLRLAKTFTTLLSAIRFVLARHQFVRYVIVGIINTAFSYGAYSAFLFSGLDYRIASLAALVLGIGMSFATQGVVVFKNANFYSFFRFIIAWSVIYMFNIAFIGLLMRVPMTAYSAGAIAIFPVTLLSYFILKFAVFGRPKREME